LELGFVLHGLKLAPHKLKLAYGLELSYRPRFALHSFAFHKFTFYRFALCKLVFYEHALRLGLVFHEFFHIHYAKNIYLEFC
ncbi:18849_t:CDS:1, partial [Racocetra persica]